MTCVRETIMHIMLRVASFISVCLPVKKSVLPVAGVSVLRLFYRLVLFKIRIVLVSISITVQHQWLVYITIPTFSKANF
jgi:hypothetical protein